MNHLLQKFFKLKEHQSSTLQELTAGLFTFLTMSYILAVNPAILGDAGMDKESVFIATALVAAFGTILMALVANLPFAIAPGMGMNAFFTYTMVVHMGYSWQSGLSAVLIAAILMTLISATPFRRLLIKAIPTSLKTATSAGIGLFLAFIGLKEAGVIVGNNATLVTLGSIGNPSVYLAFIGVLALVIMHRFSVIGSVLIVVAGLTLIGLPLGLSKAPEHFLSIPDFQKTTLFSFDFYHLFFDKAGTFDSGAIGVLLSLLLLIFFDATGTFVGLSNILYEAMGKEKAKGMHHIDKDPRYARGLVIDGASSIFASLVGSSPVTTFLESGSGIVVGKGRTGLTSLTVGVLFILALFFSPLALAVPSFATAPALIYVGLLMFQSVQNINWKEFSVAVPSATLILMTPLTYSITYGIAFGFLSYIFIQVGTGRFKKVHPMMYVVGALLLTALISSI